MILFQASGTKRLISQFPEYSMCFYSCLDSTNSECQRKYELDSFTRWLILADKQTGGRGRHGRIWQSEPGINIYLSLIFPNFFQKEVGFLNLFWGATIYETLVSLYGDFSGKLTVKWPNDIYLGDKKLCGILLQSLDSELQNIVVGIGINVYAKADQIPSTATSISLARQSGIGQEARVNILCGLLERIRPENIEPYKKDHSLVLSKFWKYTSRTLTHTYSYTSPHYTYEGILQELHEDATIEIRTPSGELIHLKN